MSRLWLWKENWAEYQESWIWAQILSPIHLVQPQFLSLWLWKDGRWHQYFSRFGPESLLGRWGRGFIMKMQILRSYFRPTKSESLGIRPDVQHFKTSPGASDAHPSSRITLFGNLPILSSSVFIWYHIPPEGIMFLLLVELCSHPGLGMATKTDERQS